MDEEILNIEPTEEVQPEPVEEPDPFVIPDIYIYSEKTNEYIGKTQAEKDPEESRIKGKFIPLVPKYATLTEPPEYEENQIPVFEIKTEEKEVEVEIVVPDYDEEGNPVMVEYEDIEVVIDYDEEGNPTGTHEITVKKQRQKTHIETETKTIIVFVDSWVIQPDYRKNFYKVDENLNVLDIDTIGEQEDYILVDKETGDLIKETPDYYKIVDNEVVRKSDEEYEAEQKQKEAERIANLRCTKRVFVMMLEKLGFDYFEQIKPLIEANRQAQLEWDLCVELERKNALLDIMAAQMGVTSEQLDNLFKAANGEITEEEFLGIEDVE